MRGRNVTRFRVRLGVFSPDGPFWFFLAWGAAPPPPWASPFPHPFPPLPVDPFSCFDLLLSLFRIAGQPSVAVVGHHRGCLTAVAAWWSSPFSRLGSPALSCFWFLTGGGLISLAIRSSLMGRGSVQFLGGSFGDVVRRRGGRSWL
ncbi:hypothetical protein RHSIM_Rhsim11G0059400 [Rhododendron simsii]|uniref:Uncharacterized protein n=1 Tax=Rhododendron simsii TaxID=118357 RepID=A0A834LC62_RHOSS|nr:hypothetical protein RHSIM_Rhsim11G0059400 [Rhododendron simsii]